MSGFNGGAFNMYPGAGAAGMPQLPPTDYGLASMQGWGNPGMDGGMSVSPEALARFGAPSVGAPSVPGAEGGIFSNMLTKTDANGITSQGWGGPALGVAQGLLSAFMGMKQYGLYKDQLQEGKRQFSLNYDAQRTTTNSALEDRQAARVASNPGAYQSVGDYMAKNQIKAG